MTNIANLVKAEVAADRAIAAYDQFIAESTGKFVPEFAEKADILAMFAHEACVTAVKESRKVGRSGAYFADLAKQFAIIAGSLVA